MKRFTAGRTGPTFLKGSIFILLKLMPNVAQYPCSVIYGNFPETFSFFIHIFGFSFVRVHEDKSLAYPFQLFVLRTPQFFQK